MTTDFRALCAELADELAAETSYTKINGEWITTNETIAAAIAAARAALAEPEPPADGEVAETVKWLREEAQISWADSCPVAAGRLTRAADLLERLAEPSSPAGGVE